MISGVLTLEPMVGAALGWLLIRRFSKLENARGTDCAIRAYHQRDGYVTSEVVPVKPLASVLTVASGGSAGYEGPVTLVGAACGSAVARIMNLTPRARRILMAAGLAAGIGALFQAPLAGAIFGCEIFYSSSDVEYETMVPSFVASAVSYTVFACFYGWAPLFSMPGECVYDSGLRLFPYFCLALVVALGARFYIMFFRATETWFKRARMPGLAKVALGGLVTGVIGFFVPDILGTSYPLIGACLSAGLASDFGAAVPSRTNAALSLSLRLGASFTYKQAHSASLYFSISNYSDNIIIGQHIATSTDIRVSVQYNYNFASRLIKSKRHE